MNSFDWKFIQGCNNVFNFLGQKLLQPKASAPISCFFSEYSAIHLHQVQKAEAVQELICFLKLKCTGKHSVRCLNTCRNSVEPPSDCSVPELRTMARKPSCRARTSFLAMPCGSKCFNRQAEFVSFSLQVLKFNKHQPPKSFASPLLDRCEEGRTHALIALGDV